MFRGDTVGDPQHLLLVVDDADGAVRVPCTARDRRGRQDAQQAFDLAQGVVGEALGGGQQDRRTVGTVLGLAQQIGGAEFAVDAVVGDHQRLGRAGEQVDADAAEQLPLGLRDIGVARTDQHVDRGDARGSERHRADRLDAAETVDLVGAGEMLRGDDRGRRLSLGGRRAGDDARHAGDLGGDDRHVRRRQQRIFAARHVAAGRPDRDVAMAEHHAGQGLDLDVADRSALRLGEAADLGLGEADVVEVAPGEPRQAGFDLRLGQPVIVAVPAVELDRQVADRLVAALGDVGENGLDGAADLRVGLVGRGPVGALLQPAFHPRPPSSRTLLHTNASIRTVR